ncbi:hypothetical protein [Pedosphaera parvula]|uniref:hypothetical protein n=1 Tax=Pedosphaera parvula TaxID=1032527 RepID=UPI0012376532|nr:hypothetical protein [Pedosphaera parvula]
MNSDFLLGAKGSDPAEKNIPSEAFHLGYIKAFDGVRGVAILLVLAFLAELTGDYTGFIGVDLFSSSAVFKSLHSGTCHLHDRFVPVDIANTGIGICRQNLLWVVFMPLPCISSAQRS